MNKLVNLKGTVSKSQPSGQKKAEVVNKGDYYSIQGEVRDEIVIATSIILVKRL